MKIFRKDRPFFCVFCGILALLLVVSLPFGILAVSSLAVPEQYGNTYYGAMKIKLDRLEETPGRRVVVIAGSSAAFGIDSQLVEEELGIPCVNFGLYAALGLKCMLDLSLNSLHDGDIVVIAPELSDQMYSDYVGYSYLLQALEGRPGMYCRLGADYAAGLLEALPAHRAEKKRFASEGSPDPDGVYSAAAFNTYGDIIYDRPTNIMDGMVAPDALPEISEELVTKDFVQMINDYVSRATCCGASVYFDFSPLNALAVDMSAADIEGFEKALRQELDCTVLSELEEHILDEGYFYDSNYHLNNAGVVLNSVLLVNNLKREMGDMTQTSTQIPPPVAGQAGGEVISSGAYGGFLYDITEQGAVITGLDSDGIVAQELIVPGSIEGVQVYKIAARAFEGCAAVRIELPPTVRVLAPALFAKAVDLTEVVILSSGLPEVGDNMLDEAPEGIILRVPASLYGDYMTDYFWGRYAGNLEQQ